MPFRHLAETKFAREARSVHICLFWIPGTSVARAHEMVLPKAPPEGRPRATHERRARAPEGVTYHPSQAGAIGARQEAASGFTRRGLALSGGAPELRTRGTPAPQAL